MTFLRKDERLCLSCGEPVADDEQDPDWDRPLHERCTEAHVDWLESDWPESE